MDPGAHSKLSDEDITAFGEQNRRFGTYHLDLWIGFHHLLDSSERKLMNFVVVIFSLKPRHLILPVCVENVTICGA